jgi:hypothetical protein
MASGLEATKGMTQIDNGPILYTCTLTVKRVV